MDVVRISSMTSERFSCWYWRVEWRDKRRYWRLGISCVGGGEVVCGVISERRDRRVGGRL